MSLTGGHRYRLAAQGIPGPEEQPATADGPDLGSPGQIGAQTGRPDLRSGASSISGFCHGLTSTRTWPCLTFNCLGPPAGAASAGVSGQPGMLGGHSWVPKLCRLCFTSKSRFVRAHQDASSGHPGAHFWKLMKAAVRVSRSSSGQIEIARNSGMVWT